MDVAGRKLVKARLPEGVAGIARLHAMIGEQLGEDAEDADQVLIGIETDRGPWVQALIAAGTRCSRSTRCRPPVTGTAWVCRARRATRLMRTCWPTWSGPSPISCARSRVTPSRPRR